MQLRRDVYFGNMYDELRKVMGVVPGGTFKKKLLVKVEFKEI